MTYDPGLINVPYYSWELHESPSGGYYWSDVLVHVTDSMGVNCMAQPTTVTVSQPLINITPITTYTEKGLDVSYRVYPHTLNPFGNNEIDYCQYLGGNNEDATEYSLIVYPNPSHGDYQIEFNSTTSSNAEILLYDVTGQLVGRYQWQLMDGLNRKNLTLQSLKQGMYFIVINIGNRVYNEKIIIE
jgi:Secretion system C-terminal sorting domain